MIIDLLQQVVLTILAFCMFFGLGFILNMLLKTTWFPIYAYFILIIVLLYWSWGPKSIIDNMKDYHFVDYLTLISGLAGAIVSGITIKFLRTRGYKMF